MDRDSSLTVSLERLVPWSPLKSNVWPIEVPITAEEVIAAAANKHYQTEPLDSWLDAKNAERTYHIQRVAYLLDHPATDAISLDVGVPALGCYVSWIVIDGNHRLAAAFIRGDKEIQAGISGETNLIKDLLGVAYPEYEEDCEED